MTAGVDCLALRDRHAPYSIDLCFIDAAHRHPWPTIDTLAVLPSMRPNGIVVHRDLQMFRGDRPHYATGSKILFELLPETTRSRSSARVEPGEATALKTRGLDNNIFAFRVPPALSNLAWAVSEGFVLGWDQNRSLGPIADIFRENFKVFPADAYGPWIAKHFDIGFRPYNAMGSRAKPKAERRLGLARTLASLGLRS